MGVNQIASGAMLYIGAGMCIVSCWLTWRQGAGSSGLTVFPGMLTPGFQSRQYGLFSVSGNKVRSWDDLMHLTCDRAAKVEVASGVVETGACNGEIGERLAEECSEHFLDSLQDRCKSYNNIYAASTGLFYATIGIAVFGVIGALCMLMPKGPLNAAKPMVLPLGVGAYLASLFIVGGYAWITDMEFWDLGKVTMYPYPSLAMGFYIYAAGMHLYLLGGLAGYAHFTGSYTEEKSEDLLAQEALLATFQADDEPTGATI